MSDPNVKSQTPVVKILGKPGSAIAYAIRDFLHRSDVPYEWIELQNNEQARAAGVPNIQEAKLPVCTFPDGTRLECPTVRQITEKLGWFRDPSRSEYDLAIYGAGPAGLSAAVYGASEGLRTVLVERYALGRQGGTSPRLEHYLRFLPGIRLPREGGRGEFLPGKGIVYLADGTKIISRASICATGVDYRRLNLPGEDKFQGAGIYYGAGSSEASLCGNEQVFIVGGGNSAAQAAVHLASFASKVTMVVREDSLKKTVSQYLIDRI